MTNSTLEAAVLVPAFLNATHRCDSCGAQAFVEVGIQLDTSDETTLPVVSSLLFCGHHYSKNESRITSLASVAFITDERSRLFDAERKRTSV